MSPRRRFLTTVGVSTAVATYGCIGVFTSNGERNDDVPGPNHSGGTLWVYNSGVRPGLLALFARSSRSGGSP